MKAGGELAIGQERLAWAIGPYEHSTPPVGDDAHIVPLSVGLPLRLYHSHTFVGADSISARKPTYVNPKKSYHKGENHHV